MCRFSSTLSFALLMAFQTGCNFFSQFREDSLKHFSKISTSRTFTETQIKDLSDLLQTLHSYTVEDEDCGYVRRALDDNKTILDLEKTYELEPFFIYDELLKINAKDLINIPETLEQEVALKIVTAWKGEATSEQLDAIILKIRKCYPENLKRDS